MNTTVARTENTNMQQTKQSTSQPLQQLTQFYCKSFDTPDEVKHIGQHERYIGKILQLPNGIRVCYSIMQPGFSINLCSATHLGFVLSGKLRVTPGTDESQSKLYVKGDVLYIPPEHTTTVEGNEPVHAIDLMNLYNASNYGNLQMFQKNIHNNADEQRKLPNAQINMINLNNEISMGLGTFKPGWKWSKDIKPIVGTDLCEHGHLMYTLSGEMKLYLPDGEHSMKGGNLIFIPPGHDAEVVGNTDAVALDFGSTKTYGIPKQQMK
jgi:quercetin dioxygenase-like cupin family protein